MPTSKPITIQSAKARLTQIANLKAGWLEEGNPAPSQHAVEQMEKFIDLIAKETTIPIPSIYPLAEGGVSCEWDKGDWTIDALIGPTGSLIEINTINFKTNVVLDLILDQNDQQKADQLMNFWQQMDEPDLDGKYPQWKILNTAPKK